MSVPAEKHFKEGLEGENAWRMLKDACGGKSLNEHLRLPSFLERGGTWCGCDTLIHIRDDR